MDAVQRYAVWWRRGPDDPWRRHRSRQGADEWLYTHAAMRVRNIQRRAWRGREAVLRDASAGPPPGECIRNVTEEV